MLDQDGEVGVGADRARRADRAGHDLVQLAPRRRRPCARGRRSAAGCPVRRGAPRPGRGRRHGRRILVSCSLPRIVSPTGDGLIHVPPMNVEVGSRLATIPTVTASPSVAAALAAALVTVAAGLGVRARRRAGTLREVRGRRPLHRADPHPRGAPRAPGAAGLAAAGVALAFSWAVELAQLTGVPADFVPAQHRGAAAARLDVQRTRTSSGTRWAPPSAWAVHTAARRSWRARGAVREPEWPDPCECCLPGHSSGAGRRPEAVRRDPDNRQRAVTERARRPPVPPARGSTAPGSSPPSPS